MSTILDAGQYTKSEIKKYEAVYGHNFISPGGLATAQEFTALLALQAGAEGARCRLRDWRRCILYGGAR